MPGSRLCSVLGGVLAAVLLAACGGGEHRATSAADAVPDSLRYGGTVTVGGYADLQSMNSLTSSDNNSGQIQREVLFMPLIKYDRNLEPVSWLAERWDTVRVAPDSLELTFHLRRDVKWHDGQPTTAKDVLFTYQRAVDPKTAFPNASALSLYSPKAVLVDPYTIKFRLRPHADFLDIWYQTPIMPEHILGKVPPDQLLTDPFGTDRPVGNGPFRFVRRVPGQEWVFAANPDFPQALGGRPYIDRLVYRYIPEQTTLLTELLTGGVDIYLGPNPAQAQQIKASPNTELHADPSLQWVYLAWNTRSPLFSDARVRRALTMAIDRQQIVDALLYGYGEPGRATVTPAHWSFDRNDSLSALPHDTAAARRLLAEAAWVDRDHDGVLEDAQGREFRFVLKTNKGNDLRKDMTEIVQAQLRPLGIVVEPRLVEWNTMTSQLQGHLDANGVRRRDFDAVISSWVDYIRKDDKDILHSSNLNEPYQYVGYANPRADALLDSMAVTVDRKAARPLWTEYQHLLAREAPYTTLYYPKFLTGVNKRVNGVETDIRGQFVSARKWWIAPSQRHTGAGDSAGGARKR